MWDYTEKYPVLLEEKESDGTIVRYTYAGNRERAYADVTKNSENEKAQVYSLYTDRLGSTRWALDENAEVAAKTEYDAWGKPETETVSSKLNGINISKSYTGYVYDETTGYWNAGARMYNSTDREFIQKDPKAGNVYETLTQNGYIYCGDNPLYYIDPDGCSYISTLGNAGRTAFNVVKSGVAGGLGFYTRVCCEIDNMPTWAKAAVGTTGIVVAGVSGVGAAAIAEAVIASAGISAVTDGAFYTVASLRNGSFSRSELKDTVINGAVNGYMFGGAGLGVAGIRNAAKSGKLAGFMADEAGSVSYEGGRKTVIYGSDDIANYQYNMIENPGPLAKMPNQPAKNFYGGRYNMEVLQEDRIMYRAGNAQNPYGRWFTSEPPASVANVKIDTAVKTHWIDSKTGVYEASSYIDNVYAIKVPKGTIIYTGPVGPQGGVHVGGYNIMQTYIYAPWTFEVVGKTLLQ